MEFVEEESRPRFLFQSRPSSSSSPQKQLQTLEISMLHLLSCFASSFLLFLAFRFFPDSEILNFVLVWTAPSLLVAPFAPSSLTGGDPRVGRGDPLPSPPSPPSDPSPDPPARRSRSRRPENLSPVVHAPNPIRVANRSPAPNPNKAEISEEEEEEESREWTDEDFDLLMKQISKHPVGEPRRWERIAEAFRGRHRLESVIKMGKSLAERRPPESKDSFSQFLRQRKPLDKRVDNIATAVDGREAVRESVQGWSSGEDIALLNALKAFPKDVEMRWEKVAASVPGRSKAECMKRVTELKKDFRSAKNLGS